MISLWAWLGPKRLIRPHLTGGGRLGLYGDDNITNKTITISISAAAGGFRPGGPTPPPPTQAHLACALHTDADRGISLIVTPQPHTPTPKRAHRPGPMRNTHGRGRKRKRTESRDGNGRRETQTKHKRTGAKLEEGKRGSETKVELHRPCTRKETATIDEGARRPRGTARRKQSRNYDNEVVTWADSEVAASLPDRVGDETITHAHEHDRA